MAQYTFTTIWRIEAPLNAAWRAISAVERWPEWWRGVEAVVPVRPGDSAGIGTIYRYTWKSQLPYRLIFDMETIQVMPLRCLEGRAYGELEGTGCWTFEATSRVTTIRYDWNVATTSAWMNLMAPLARPLFEWNHNVVMAWGGEGLAQLLHTRLLPADPPAANVA